MCEGTAVLAGRYDDMETVGVPASVYELRPILAAPAADDLLLDLRLGDGIASPTELASRALQEGWLEDWAAR